MAIVSTGRKGNLPVDAGLLEAKLASSVIFGSIEALYSRLPSKFIQVGDPLRTRVAVDEPL